MIASIKSDVRSCGRVGQDGVRTVHDVRTDVLEIYEHLFAACHVSFYLR